MPIRITGLNSGLDTDSIVKELVSAYSIKKDKYVKAQTKLEWKQDAWKEMNSKIYGFYSKTLSNIKMLGNFTSKKTTTISDSTKAKISADSTVTNGTQKLKVNALASAGYLTGQELKKANGDKITNDTMLGELGVRDGSLQLKVGGETKTVNVTADMKISDLTKALKEQGIATANFDATQQRLFLNSASGVENDFEFVATDQSSLDILNGLGLATKDNYEQVHGTGSAPTDKTFANKTDATNAVIELNGVVFESATNEFAINGLNITALGVSEEMTITTATDVDGIYNMVKDFLKEYNEVMNSMEKAFNAASAKGYEPLTDDEKSEMSDKEVEKWESKIKDSILRRDDTLSSIMSTMSMAMSRTFEVDGKTYSLSSFGISTAGYFNRTENESYALHIDGDPDDTTSSANADKLRKAIEQDPDTFASFFTQMATGLYEDLHEKMGSTELSSVFTVYNDKQMKIEYDEYTETIKKWEEKLEQIEESYYKKFAAMEKALATLQSQQNSLSSLLGG